MTLPDLAQGYQLVQLHMSLGKNKTAFPRQGQSGFQTGFKFLLRQ